MGLKVAPASMPWSQPSVPQSPPSSSQALASAISSPSSTRRIFLSGDGALFCRFAERSCLFYQKSNLHRTGSSGNKRCRTRIIRKALSASLDSFSDEEFSKKIQELTLRFQLSEDNDDRGIRKMDEILETRWNNAGASSNGEEKFLESFRPFDFPDRDEIIPANIERKANSVDIPLSLRIIKKKKKQWQGGLVEAGESAYCSMKKAFSSMVFIIRELHSYTLQMRSILFYEDMQGIVANVQKEIHASFVWLFQTVFSQTPTLMVSVMILLANYSVYSMSSNAALAAAPPLQSYTTTTTSTEEVSVSFSRQKFDSSIIKTLKLASSTNNGKTASVGGNNGGGGGKSPRVASGTEGDGRFDESNYYSTISPNGASSVVNPSRTSGGESVSSMEEEAVLRDSIVEEASLMQDGSTDGVLDQEMMKRFVSPFDAKIEVDDHSQESKHFVMELLYQRSLAQDPNNPLLLANYAQFLYLVVRDLDRAEEYFKRATQVEPKDAEALNKYANFLWLARNDLWAAEETYLEAIAAEPQNSVYAGNYAHFLWNTGGEDTCFPLSSPDEEGDSM